MSTWTCEICNKPVMKREELTSDEAGDYHKTCYRDWLRQSALEAGIPESVVDGKTKLRDHFSQEYIDFKCNKGESND